MDVRAVGVIVLGALVLASGTAPGENLLTVEPESYRSENYRSPTPATLRVARVITTPEAQNLRRARRIVGIPVTRSIQP